MQKKRNEKWTKPVTRAAGHSMEGHYSPVVKEQHLGRSGEYISFESMPFRVNASDSVSGKIEPGKSTQANSLKLALSPSAPNLQLKHASVSEAVANFKNTVTPQNEAAGSGTLTATGQFYWTKQIVFQIEQYLKQLRPVLPGNAIWESLLDWIASVVNAWPHDRATHWSNEIQRYLTIISTSQLPENIAVSAHAKALLKPLFQYSGMSGQAIYYDLWAKLNKADQVPNLNSYANLPSLQAIWSWENQACGYTGGMVANRFVRKGGAKSLNPDAKRQKSTRVWQKFAASGERDMRKLSGGVRMGDMLKQTGVSGALQKMQDALDDGWILHARVLSGIDYGWGGAAKTYDKQAEKGKAPAQPQAIGAPPEEHSIMIIGYDGNEFVFWDPDSGSSNRHGAGFGSLFLVNDRLSTADSSATFPVNDEGDHANGDHRYQVITISSQ